MRSVKFRRNRLQRGGAGGNVLERIDYDDIINGIYEFEIFSVKNKNYLFIKKTPQHKTDQIGLIIVTAYKANDENINMMVLNVEKVQDFTDFVLYTEPVPSDIIIEANILFKDKLSNIIKQQEEEEKQAGVDRVREKEAMQSGGKRSRKRRRKRRRTTRRRKSRKY